MGEVSYKPIIQEMTWSYSRLSSYEKCPYRWFLKYIKHYKPTEHFYASYGSFIHHLLEQYYTGMVTAEDLPTLFLTGFQKEVKGVRPSPNITQKYIDDGLAYFQHFQPLPFHLLAVEKKVSFTIYNHPFTGIIDYLGEMDGEIYIVDHKSRALKPRSTRKNPTANDKELDDMLHQLYLYAIAVEAEYGCPPKALCFNCFRNHTFITEPYDKTTSEHVKQWTTETIEKIENTGEFYECPDYFTCRYLCEVNAHCPFDPEAK